MAELRIAVVHYEHKNLSVSNDGKGMTVGQQIDQFIAETISNGITQHGGPSPISEVNLTLDIGEQHVLLDAFLRDGSAQSGGKKAKAY